MDAANMTTVNRKSVSPLVERVAAAPVSSNFTCISTPELYDPGISVRKHVPGTFWDGHGSTRYIPYKSWNVCKSTHVHIIYVPGTNMDLPGTFHIGTGTYVGLPCTYYICPWDLLEWTWTYQVHFLQYILEHT